MKDYDDIEGINFEQVTEDDPDIVCWSVYLHCKTGGLESICDFSLKSEALVMEEWLSVRLSNARQRNPDT